MRKSPILIAAAAASLYLLSPPRELTIRINATPAGAQAFVVTVRSSRPGLDAHDVHRVARQLVAVNRDVRIPLAADQVQWFGRLTAEVFHPEYFLAWAPASNRFVRPQITLEPAAWADALDRGAPWVSEPPASQSPGDQASQQSGIWQRRLAQHQVLHISHANYQAVAMDQIHFDTFAGHADPAALSRSIQVLERIVAGYDEAASVAEFEADTPGQARVLRTQRDRTRTAMTSLRRRVAHLPTAEVR